GQTEAPEPAGREGLHPGLAGRRDLADYVRADVDAVDNVRLNAGDRVGAVGGSDRGLLAGIELAVVIAINVNPEPGQAALSGVADAVAVEVLELYSADRPELEVADVHLGRVQVRVRDVEGRLLGQAGEPQGGGRLDRPGRVQLDDGVVGRRQLAGGQAAKLVEAIGVRGRAGDLDPGIRVDQADEYVRHARLARVL